MIHNKKESLEKFIETPYQKSDCETKLSRSHLGFPLEPLCYFSLSCWRFVFRVRTEFSLLGVL